MFIPNQSCVIYAASGASDVYGMPMPGTLTNERCTVVKFNIVEAKSAVRADTSASRGNAREFETDAEILLTAKTIAVVDDVIQVYGVKVRVMAKFPRHNLQGVLDHFQVTCSYWGAQ